MKLQSKRRWILAAGAFVLALFVIDRFVRAPEADRLRLGFIAGAAIFFAIDVRTPGIALLPTIWLAEIQKFLPLATLTILLDIAPETAVQRKAVDRDRYERDMALLGRVRASYHRQAEAGGWVVIDGERSKDAIAADVLNVVAPRLELP